MVRPVAVEPNQVKRVVRNVEYIGVAWAESQPAAIAEADRLRKFGLRTRSAKVAGNENHPDRFVVMIPTELTHQEKTIWNGIQRSSKLDGAI